MALGPVFPVPEPGNGERNPRPALAEGYLVRPKSVGNPLWSNFAVTVSLTPRQPVFNEEPPPKRGGCGLAPPQSTREENGPNQSQDKERFQRQTPKAFFALRLGLTFLPWFTGG